MKAVIYSLFKYLEIGSLALVNLILAEKVGPTQLGLLMPILIFITYSNYSTFGAPQLILKYLPRKYTLTSKELLIDSSSKLLSIGFLITLIAGFIFLELKHVGLVFYICAATFTSSFIASKLRVDVRFLPINIANFLSSVGLLVLTFYYVQDVYSYLSALVFAKSCMLLVYVLADFKFFSNSFKSLLRRIKLKVFYFYGRAALSMALSGIAFTILMSIDRLIIQSWQLDSVLLGVYQLADTIGMAFYLGVTTFLFYFYPVFLKKINEDKVFRNNYLRILLGISLVPFIMYYPAKMTFELFEGVLFESYPGVWSIVPKIIFLKMALVIYSSLLTYYISRSKDMIGVCITVALTFSIVLINFLFISPDQNGLLLLPIACSLAIFIFIFGIVFSEYKNNKVY
ncbi:hypothetical protein QL995_02635 [Pseudoalteromonas sp. APC 3358]|uniref:hypothetical protein n=1 Tax=unclassified Pseudoalteromonas TaxID=194690 RepID=UPI000C341F29|nr:MULTISPECIES: hypothetical protein [unclassified Pseudoalteromonas]MDN3381577.1 hypothetical protein [Pseudoalteromonas sp. APC 3358]PKH93557.1 hypothetical protein CXF76_00610 [Pseudoalteromonas sp. 78C3]